MSTDLLLNARLNRTAGPTSQPVSVADARRQLNIAESDDSHDAELYEAIEAAREQVEFDTPYVTTEQTFEYILDGFPRSCDKIMLPVRPVQTVDSITYEDETTTETLATTVYKLDQRKRAVVLKYDQEWPSITRQPDAVIITVTAGYATPSVVPRLIKRAILLQVAKWFEDRDMMWAVPEQQYDLAYERIIRRLMRASYP